MSILDIKNVTYRADQTIILNGISLKVKEGDCISIVGQSGSGKSTLLKLCADLIPLTEGEICYRGISYKEQNPIALRRKISYCIQIPQLFGKTVRENLEFPSKVRKEHPDYDRIRHLMRQFLLPISYLEKEITALSGGEKQRIALIRNLLYTPDLLLLDEVTSALDTDTANVVEEYIKQLKHEGVTVIWITHNLEQSERIFSKRITMAGGMIERMEEFQS